MATTYDDLVSNIKTYSGRTDSGTLNSIPQFIAAAQSKLDATLRIAEMITTQVFPAAGTTTPPITMLETESVVIGDIEGSLSTLKEVLYARKFASPDDLLVCRHNYTMNGNALELVTPQEVTITGYQKPPRISTSLQTNAYTQGAENALLWLSLGYLSMFVQDTDTAKSWSAMAENEIDSLNEAHSAYQMIGTVEAQNMSTSNEKNTHGLIKFIGFGGLLALITIAVSAGRFQESFNELNRTQNKLDSEMVKMNTTLADDVEETHLQSYRVTAIEHRVDKLEAK